MQRLFLSLFVVIVFASSPLYVSASHEVTLDAETLVPGVSISFSPRSGSFVEGSTFQVPIVLDTNGNSINGIEVRLNYDSERLAITQASTGQSIIGVWVEPPTYDNSRGTASYVGVVPGGVVTESGVIGTITFRAKSAGRAVVSVRSDSNILLNNGLGSPATVEKGRAEYAIITKPPAGVSVYSETHPSQSSWYNNNSPVIAWDHEQGILGYSYSIDNKPNTIPDNVISSTDSIKSFENLSDGLWYFHIKSNKNGVWGSTTHFLVRIDTTPPARFTPQVNYVLATVVSMTRTLVSFFTTDNLSGVERYEVGVIDKGAPATQSPAFVEAQSPFQISAPSEKGMTVVVRAIDRAGNVRDETVDVMPPSSFVRLIESNLIYLLFGAIALVIIGFLTRFYFGHHIETHVRRVIKVLPVKMIRPMQSQPLENTSQTIDLRPHEAIEPTPAEAVQAEVAPVASREEGVEKKPTASEDVQPS